MRTAMRPPPSKPLGYRPTASAALIFIAIVAGAIGTVFIRGRVEDLILFCVAVVYIGICVWVGSIARRYYGADKTGWGFIAFIATPPLALLALIAIAVGVSADMAKRAKGAGDGGG